MEARFSLLGDSANLDADRCTVCAKRTIGSLIILDAPDGILGEWVMSNLISIHLETVLVSVQDWCMVCGKHTMAQKSFWRTRWYSKVMRLKWKLVSVRLEIMLILTQDRCMVCAERIIG